MNRIFAVFLTLLFLPTALMAADCFDLDAWRQAVVLGDNAAATSIIDRAKTACGCAAEETACLQVPGFSQLSAPLFWRETTQRLLSWRNESRQVCGKLPEQNESEKTARHKCFTDRAAMFAEGLAGETYGRTLASIPLAMIEKISTPGPVNNDRITGPEVGKAMPEEAEEIGRQLCVYIPKLNEAYDLLEHVKRRTNNAMGEKWRRITELESQIKDLNDRIVSLKDKYTRLTGKKYDAYLHCGPQEDKKSE